MDWKGRLAMSSALGMLAVNSQACLLLSAFARPQVALLAKSNMVVWEPASQTEHLVLSLALLSKSSDFDIIIPTPTKPSVAVVGQQPFAAMYSVLHPAPDIDTLIRQGLPKLTGNEPAEDVEPKDRYARDLKVQTIQASDVVGLTSWMEKMKYKPSDSAKAWLQRYVDRRWYLTAVHVKSTYDMFKTDGVRFSFKTDMPYCPNYTTNSTWANSVRQELYVVSPTQLKVMVGKNPWKGQPMTYSYLGEHSSSVLAKHLKVADKSIPKNSWLSWAVEVGNNNSASDDLYFVPDKPVKPTTKVGSR